MRLDQIIILGFVQGITEFLPVSSTAHLILLPWFFKWPDPGLVFDIALHLGTLFAILTYFRQDLWEIVTSRRPLLMLLLVATVPGIVFGALFESKAETVFRSPELIALTLAVFGVILWLADSKLSHSGNLNNLNKKKAFLIGLGQALAVIPGVSRSGAAMTFGLFTGLSREAAVRFSFLLSVPIIAGGAAVGIYKIVRIGVTVPNNELILGILTSFVAGLLAIGFLLNLVKKQSFLPFVIYRLILALVIILFITKI